MTARASASEPKTSSFRHSSRNRPLLTLLAPEIVEAILDGRQPEGLTLPGLMFPVEWERQRAWQSS